MASLYTIHRLLLGRTEPLDALARECGRLYSETLTAFWRTVRKKGLWLKPSSLMRWKNSDRLHAHTADACVQAFFAALHSWRARRKADPTAKPPKRGRRFFRIEYKSSAIRLGDGRLRLSNGQGNAPLVLPWKWDCPKTVVIHWTGTEYEAIATYVLPAVPPVAEGRVVAVDMGEIHPAVTSDGDIANGRYLRSLRRLRNKGQAEIQAKLDRKQRGSRRCKRLKQAQRRFLRKTDCKIQDVLHKTTRRLVSTWQATGVQTVVIGDVRAIRQGNDKGHVQNQRLHQWPFGKVRWYLSYKAEREGMAVVLQDEAYTSQTCPAWIAGGEGPRLCGHRTKPKGREYRCPSCGFVAHRDLVGATNLLRKYLQKYQGEAGIPVAGRMARPRGFRYHPNLCCSV